MSRKLPNQPPSRNAPPPPPPPPSKLKTTLPKTVWQPIETAPSGEMILVWWEHIAACCVAILVKDNTWKITEVICGTDASRWSPTHWIPFPSFEEPGNK